MHTFQATLRMLYERGTGLKCYQAPLEALYHGDSGVALQLLHAGFNMASLMARYQGVDWRITATWNCNDGCVLLCVGENSNVLCSGPHQCVMQSDTLEERVAQCVPQYSISVVSDLDGTHRVSPMGSRSYDGIDMHPYESVFLPLEQRMLDVRFGAAIIADKYSTWLAHTPVRSTTTR